MYVSKFLSAPDVEHSLPVVLSEIFCKGYNPNARFSGITFFSGLSLWRLQFEKRSLMGCLFFDADFSKIFHSFVCSFLCSNFFKNCGLCRCDRFAPIIVQIRAILAIYRTFEDFRFLATSAGVGVSRYRVGPLLVNGLL